MARVLAWIVQYGVTVDETLGGDTKEVRECIHLSQNPPSNYNPLSHSLTPFTQIDHQPHPLWAVGIFCFWWMLLSTGPISRVVSKPQRQLIPAELFLSFLSPHRLYYHQIIVPITTGHCR